jgi:hypothetical protein
MRVYVDGESEVRGQIAADLSPVVAGIVRPHHIPMLLHEEHTRPRRMHRDMVHTMADFRRRIGNVLGIKTPIDRLPGQASIVAAKGSRCGDGDKDPIGIARVENHRMQTHSAGARLPLWTGSVAAQSGKLRP